MAFVVVGGEPDVAGLSRGCVQRMRLLRLLSLHVVVVVERAIATELLVQRVSIYRLVSLHAASSMIDI